MTIKKALCAVLAAFLLFTLTACKSVSKPNALTITLNGVTVSAPLTVEKLGSDYSVKFDPDIKIGEIFYKDQNLGLLVTFDENTAEHDHRKKNIKTLNGRCVSVNGITYGSSKSEVINAIGSPTETEKMDGGWWTEGWLYRKGGKAKGERYLVVFFDKNEKISGMEVDLELL